RSRSLRSHVETSLIVSFTFLPSDGRAWHEKLARDKRDLLQPSFRCAMAQSAGTEMSGEPQEDWRVTQGALAYTSGPLTSAPREAPSGTVLYGPGYADARRSPVSVTRATGFELSATIAGLDGSLLGYPTGATDAADVLVPGTHLGVPL